MRIANRRESTHWLHAVIALASLTLLVLAGLGLWRVGTRAPIDWSELVVPSLMVVFTAATLPARTRGFAATGLSSLLVTVLVSPLGWSSSARSVRESRPVERTQTGGEWRLDLSGEWTSLLSAPVLSTLPSAPQTVHVQLNGTSTERLAWHARATRTGFAVLHDIPYVLRVRVRAVTPRPAAVAIYRADHAGAPPLLWSESQLIEGWQELTAVFESPDDSAANVTLHLGQDPSPVDIEPPVLEVIAADPDELLTWDVQAADLGPGIAPPRLRRSGPGNAVLTVTIPSVSPASRPGDVQLNFRGASLLRRHPYTLSFEARASSPRLFAVAVARSDSPFDSLGLYRQESIGSSWRSFSYRFDAIDDAAHARVFFDLGAAAVDVELRHVSLRAGPSGVAPVRVRRPASRADSPMLTAIGSIAEPLALIVLGLLYRPWLVDASWLFGLTNWLGGSVAGVALARGTGFPFLGSLTVEWLFTGTLMGLLALAVAHRIGHPLGSSGLAWRRATLFVCAVVNVGTLTWALSRATTEPGGTAIVIAIGLVSTLLVAHVAARGAGGVGRQTAPVVVRYRVHVTAPYLTLVVALAAVLAAESLFRVNHFTPALAFYVFVNRLFCYGALMLAIHLAGRLSLERFPAVHALYVAAASLLPLTIVLDYFVYERTGIGVPGWLNTLIHGNAAADVRQLLAWSGIRPAIGLALVSAGIVAALGAMGVLVRLSRRWPGQIRWSRGLAAAVVIMAAAIAIESVSGFVLFPEAALTHGRAFSVHAPKMFGPGGDIRMLFREPPAADRTRLNAQGPSKWRPDIFLFVIDSLRSDALTREIAPHLTALRDTAWTAERTFAGSYGSELSWFALLHGRHSFRWATDTDTTGGAYPLAVLRQLGYRVEARLTGDHQWKDMAARMFGQSRELADVFIDAQTSSILSGMVPHERDRVMIADLVRLLDTAPGGGHVYIQELMSAHWPYAWPADHRAPREAWTADISFTQLTYSSQDVARITNSYYNAVSWADALMGRFLSALKQRGRYADSLVIVVGDHGEDLYEEGRWAHGTDLCRHQTEVPIVIKWPAAITQPKARAIMGLVDVMPSLLDVLDVDSQLLAPLDGVSAFEPRQSLLLSGPSFYRERAGLLFANGTERMRLAFWSTRDDGRLNRLLAHERSDWQGRPLPLPTAAELPTLLKTLYPEIAAEIFDANGR